MASDGSRTSMIISSDDDSSSNQAIMGLAVKDAVSRSKKLRARLEKEIHYNQMSSSSSRPADIFISGESIDDPDYKESGSGDSKKYSLGQ